MIQDLSMYDRRRFIRGRHRVVEMFWILFSGLFFSTWLPGSVWRRCVLRWFGARVGRNVVIKPRVRIKFPWRLDIGDNVWIGESVWFDNLAMIKIGPNSCVSQGAYLCTGNHDWNNPNFALIVSEIDIADECWIGAHSFIGPGCVVSRAVVVKACSSLVSFAGELGIYAGNPAKLVGVRRGKSASGGLKS